MSFDVIPFSAEEERIMDCHQNTTKKITHLYTKEGMTTGYT